MVQPNFLVIGAYKCGTTSLHNHLRAHPDVFVPAHKEPGYWAFVDEVAGRTSARPNPAKGRSITDPAAYQRLFDPWAGQTAVGEVSPEYMTHPDAARVIARELPDARLIAIVRDPVERAFSDFLMNVRDGRESADFAAAIGEQDARAASGAPTGYYLSTGFYGAQLEPYYELFGRDRILVVLAEDLKADQAATLGRIFRFLGVDPSAAVDPGQEFNRSGVPSSPLVKLAYRVRTAAKPLARVVPESVKHRIDRSLQDRLERPEMPAEVAAELRRIYQPDIELLESLTGLDLTRWRSG